MGALIDLTGQRFGRLTVLEMIHGDSKRKIPTKCKCQCDCGNIKNINSRNLRDGRTKSCGCLNKKLISERAKKRNKKYVDLIGNKYKYLTVVSFKERRKNKDYWLCKCECGNEKITDTYSLVYGHTTKCSRTCDCGTDKESAKKAVLISMKEQNRLKKGNNRKLEFTLTDDEILSLITKPCFYCGEKHSNIKKTNHSYFKYNGIDRINSNEGYVHGNVVSCCKICNRAKNSLSINEFYEWIKKINMNFTEEKFEKLNKLTQ